MSTPVIPPLDSPNPEPKPPAPVSIKDAVATRLASSGDTVRERVLAILTEEEVEKRAQLILKGVSLVDQARRDLSKASKPDQVIHDGEGKAITEGFSKNALDTKTKAKAKLDKLESALNKALNHSQFDELTKMAAGGGDNQRQDKGSGQGSKVDTPYVDNSE